MLVKKIVTAAAVTALAVSGVLVGPMSPASAKTVIFCVQKKSGDVVQPKKKKCKKGWKKVKVNSEGPQGPAGPQLSVKDRNGATVGTFMGYYSIGSNSSVLVLIDGGVYQYTLGGNLQPTDVSYKTADCSGPAYAYAESESRISDYSQAVGSTARMVERVTYPAYGPATAFEMTGTREALTVPTALYYRMGGTCSLATDSGTGALFALRQIPAPADHPGPLTVG